MALYRFVKAPAAMPKIRRKPVGWSFILMGLGSGILIWALWPIVSFLISSDSVFSKIITPVDESQKMISPYGLSPIAFAAGSSEGLLSPSSGDFTNANVWYPTVPQKHVVTPVNTYTLSIPKLKIENAPVVIGGDDLNAGLVHYGGTGLPGQYGVGVIFGHSTLPQFYSPTNYKTIFSLLPTLKVGDDIDILYDGVQYTYSIYDMEVLDPSDLSGLEQRFDDSYITLVTCVPPGTLWKRLYVKAKLHES